MGTVARGWALNCIFVYTYDTGAPNGHRCSWLCCKSSTRTSWHTGAPPRYYKHIHVWHVAGACVYVCVCSDINHLRKLLDTHVTHLETISTHIYILTCLCMCADINRLREPLDTQVTRICIIHMNWWPVYVLYTWTYTYLYTLKYTCAYIYWHVAEVWVRKSVLINCLTARHADDLSRFYKHIHVHVSIDRFIYIYIYIYTYVYIYIYIYVYIYIHIHIYIYICIYIYIYIYVCMIYI